jgi:hypothetical protein
MRKFRIGFMCVLATLLVAFVAGCGQETVTLPSVVSVTPAQGSANVAVGTTITATFSQAMSAASISATTFKVAAQGGGAVTGTVAYSGLVATFTPTSNGGALAYNTTYTATITTGAATPGGAELIGPYAWSFTTGAPTPLTVAVTPAPFANPVALAAPITATFSQTMICATLASPATSFTVTAPASDVAVTGTVTCAGSVATFTPTGGALPSFGTTYTATITTGATDVIGFPLASGNYVWTFTTLTLPPVPTPAPMVIYTNPVTPSIVAPIVLENTNVPLNQIVSATFNEPMDSGTIVLANFTLTHLVLGVPTPVSGGTVTYAPSTNALVYHLSANLASGTEYTATVTGGDLGVRSSAGQPMASNYSWKFMTGTTANNTPPELVKTVPGDTAPGVEAVGVPLNQAVSATFSKSMDSSTLTPATFLLYTGTTATGTPLPAKITYNDTTFIATLTPTAQLLPTTFYTATVTNGATDTAGNPLGNTPTSPFTNTWTFETGLAAVPPPVVLGPVIAPFGGFAGSAGMTNTGLTTVINGESGTTATAYSAYTGFHDNSVLIGGVAECTYTETTAPPATGLVTGTIYSPLVSTSTFCPLEGTAADIAIATEALAEARTAYTTLQGLPGGLDFTTHSLVYGGGGPGELGSSTLAPGIYKSAPGSYGITIGDLTLDAQGDPNATWVFQMASTLTVGQAAVPRNVILINGAKASNVYWAVGSDVTHLNMAGGGTFDGTVIANGAVGIAVSTVGNTTITTINGRLISLNASTTLVDTVINVPTP